MFERKSEYFPRIFTLTLQARKAESPELEGSEFENKKI